MSADPTAQQAADPAVEPAKEATPGSIRAEWRGGRARSVPIPADQAARQGAISRLAFLLLGREAAIAFLNTLHAGLGGRPLALATASPEGRAAVEAELARMTCREPGEHATEMATVRQPLDRTA